MRKDMQLKRFVHASCAKVKQAVVDKCNGVREKRVDSFKDMTGRQSDRFKDVTEKQRSASAEEAGQEQENVTATSTLPHGLAKSSLKDYSNEWMKYLLFATQRRTLVPGKDVKWDLDLVWEYLRFRSRTCKPETIKQVLTKLAHFGARYKFVLPTSKFDGDPCAYRSVSKMKKQLAIDARAAAAEAGTDYEPVDRCTPIGQRGVSMILSAFALWNERQFNRLSRRDRHHVAALMMQHTGGMRFGGFAAKNYTSDSFIADATASLHLITDWSRYQREQFAIEFSTSPRFEAMWYKIYAPNGDMIETYPAATVLHWHLRRLQRDGERLIFAPVAGETCSRDDRQKWIRDALFDALPLSEREARIVVDDVTPHSFRAGLAGDLFRAGVSLQRISSICRWFSRVVRTYAERPCMSSRRLTNGFRLIKRY